MLAALFAIILFQNPNFREAREATDNIAIVLNDEYRKLAQLYFPTPENGKIVSSLTPAPRTALPNQLSVLVWNVWKGQGQQNFSREFHLLSARRDLSLLQEGMADSFMLPVLRREKSQGWTMATSFYVNQGSSRTGTITGSVAAPLQALGVRSPQEEPFLVTPKTALATSYLLESGSRLLVVNIHGINFVLNSYFREHIEQLLPLLRGFKGKVLFAGDFNTWNPGRLQFLTQALHRAGFEQAVIPDDDRFLKLDHIFVKGCKIRNVSLHGWAKSSDHKPLTCDLDCR